MLALDKQVGRLFHSDIEFLGLEIFFASNYDEELVCYLDVPLQLKLKGHICFVWCYLCTIQSDSIVPSLLALEGALVDNAIILVKGLDPDVWSTPVHCGRLAKQIR